MKKFISILLTICLVIIPLMQISALGGGVVSQSDKIYSDNAAGEMIVRIQLRLRELGYLGYRPTGIYRSMTTAAVKEFQARCGAFGDSIGVDGRIGPITMERLFNFNAPRPKIADEVHMPKGPTGEGGELKISGGTLQEWSMVKEALKVGAVYRVIDCNTEREFELIFTGGQNHAEMELASGGELENFKYICGDAYNYLKRPILVEIDGRLIAASIQCFPHGSDSVEDNEMSGHVCVFFKGSLSHVGMLPDVEHNANVFAAAGH